MEADFAFKKYGGRKYFFDTLPMTLDFQGQI